MLMEIRQRKGWIKAVFIGLIIAFAGGFVIGGVGSGNGGFSLSDIIGNNNGSSSTNGSIGSLQRQVKANASDETAWNQLGHAYQAAQQNDQAISAFEKAVALKASDSDAQTSLASLYQGKASALANQAAVLQQQAQALRAEDPLSSSTALSPSSAIGTALASPISQARSSSLSTAATHIEEVASSTEAQAQSWYHKALFPYAKLTQLNPKDAQLWIQYGLTSRDAGDNAGAVRALKRFLVLAPHDPDAAQVKALVRQLRAAGTTSAGGSSSITVGG